MDTINRLLKKQAPKRRGRAKDIINTADGEVTPNDVEEEEPMVKPDLLFVRWVSNRFGSRIGVPEEWLEAPVGELFASRSSNGKTVQAVEG